MSGVVRATAAVSLSLMLLACGDDDRDPIRPITIDVRGTYTLTQLRFDPQGSLPEVDIRPRIQGNIPRLVLGTNGRAQLVFEHPETGLITISEATYSATASQGVQIDFGTGTVHQTMLLSRRMPFVYTEANGSLAFSAAAPDGVSRQTLIQLVPELEEEQLFDPVPGQLTVVFERSQ